MVADLPDVTTAVLAATPRPSARSAFTEKATAVGWTTISSTFIVGRNDRAIDRAELLLMAHRAQGRVWSLMPRT